MHSKLPLDKLIEKFLKSRQCFNLVPLGSAATLPVPIKLNGKFYLSFLFYTGKKLELQNKIQIYPPHTKIFLDYSTARIVKYVDLLTIKNSDAEKWKEPIGEFPHKEIETLTLKEFKNRKSELILDYEKAITLFNGITTDENFKDSFRGKFYQLCEPPLIPYLKDVGPKFFEWLNKE